MSDVFSFCPSRALNCVVLRPLCEIVLTPGGAQRLIDGLQALIIEEQATH